MRWKWPGADSDSASFTLVFVVPAKPKSFGVLWHSGHMVRAAAVAWLVIATLSVGRAVLIHYPRQLIFRFPAFAVLGFVLPFGFQRPDYVLRQDELWIHWGLNNRGFGEFEDLWFLLANQGVMLDQQGHSIVQLGAAAAVAAFCFQRRRASAPRKELVCTVLGLTCGWMVLLGPATESCTYVLFAPAMAWVVLEAYLAAVPAWQRALALSSFAIFTAGQIAFWFPWGGALNAIGTFPFTAFLAVAAIVVAELRWRQPAPELATGWEGPEFLPLVSAAAARMPAEQRQRAA